MLVSQLLGLSFSLVFTLIFNRTRVRFIPIRDYAVFVGESRKLAETASQQQDDVLRR